MQDFLSNRIDPDFLRFTGKMRQFEQSAKDRTTGVGRQEANVKAAREFESFVLYYLIKTMRETVRESDLLGNRKAEHTYRSMLDEQIANQLAESGGLGLGKMIESQLERQDEDRTGVDPGKTRAGSSAVPAHPGRVPYGSEPFPSDRLAGRKQGAK